VADWKYIMLDWDGVKVPIIFPSTINHAEMAKAATRAFMDTEEHDGRRRRGEVHPIAGGFIRGLSVEQTAGRSESLSHRLGIEIAAAPADTDVINRYPIDAGKMPTYDGPSPWEPPLPSFHQMKAQVRRDRQAAPKPFANHPQIKAVNQKRKDYYDSLPVPVQNLLDELRNFSVPYPDLLERLAKHVNTPLDATRMVSKMLDHGLVKQSIITGKSYYAGIYDPRTDHPAE
jgi:hypothetical protein